MKCPYCAEEIQDAAVKCKHCGEWLDKSKQPAPPVVKVADAKPNYSGYQIYSYRVRDAQGNTVTRLAFGTDPENALKNAMNAVAHGETLDDKSGVKLSPRGRFNCPNCGSAFTVCERDMGCVFVLIVFVSLGLGLLLIPLLPFKCGCNACGYRWKT